MKKKQVAACVCSVQAQFFLSSSGVGGEAGGGGSGRAHRLGCSFSAATWRRLKAPETGDAWHASGLLAECATGGGSVASGQGGRRPASESGLAKGVPTALPIVCGVWSPHRLARWCGHAGDTPLSSGRRCHHRRAAQGFLEIVLPHGTECRPCRAGMRGGLSFKRSGPAMTAMCAVVSELAERVEAAGW